MDGPQLMEGNLNIAPLMVWVGVLAALLAFGTNVWGIFSSPSKANAQRLREVSARLDAHDLRMQRLDQSLQVIPSKDDMHAVQISLEALRGEFKAMRAEMGGTKDIMERLETVVTRHEDYLLKNGGKP